MSRQPSAMEWAAKQAHIKQLVLVITDDADNTHETVQYNLKDWDRDRLPVELIMDHENTNLKPTQTIVGIRILTEEMGALFMHPNLSAGSIKEVLANMDEFAPLEFAPTYVVVNAEALPS